MTTQALARQAMTPVTGTQARQQDARAATDDSYSFADVIDAVNPLHHVPIVSTVYEAATGDQIKPVSRLAGGFLFGGTVGLLSSAATVALEAVTGDSVAGHIRHLAGSLGKEDAPPQPTAGFPWLRTEAAATGAPTDVSEASLSAALARLRPAVGSEFAAAPAQAAVKPVPAAETVARLYELETTRPADRRPARV